MTDTKTVTLTEFLRARLDEDYEVAWGAAPSPWREGKWDGSFDGPREVVGKFDDVTAVCYYGGTYGHVLRFDPTRVLKDIEAKRRIVETWVAVWNNTCDPDDAFWVQLEPTLRAILRHLAAVYSDHPDYREEWKP